MSFENCKNNKKFNSKSYTLWEESFLRENYNFLTCKEISEKLNRSVGSIRVKASKLKLENKKTASKKAPTGKKICSSCREIKYLNNFGYNKKAKDGKNWICRDCLKQSRKLKVNAKKEYDKIYRKNLPIKTRISRACRRRFKWLFFEKKTNIKIHKFVDLVGCSPEFLIKYLESKFTKGMSWDNYGFRGWHIDHIKPCASFNLFDDIEVKKCFHYSNLQPLWMKDNMSKWKHF